MNSVALICYTRSSLDVNHRKRSNYEKCPGYTTRGILIQAF